MIDRSVGTMSHTVSQRNTCTDIISAAMPTPISLTTCMSTGTTGAASPTGRYTNTNRFSPGTAPKRGGPVQQHAATAALQSTSGHFPLTPGP